MGPSVEPGGPAIEPGSAQLLHAPQTVNEHVAWQLRTQRLVDTCVFDEWCEVPEFERALGSLSASKMVYRARMR